jgi:hypothetical protein
MVVGPLSARVLGPAYRGCLRAKAPGATALGFPPGRRHPLGLPTPIYCTIHDLIDLSNLAAIPLH